MRRRHVIAFAAAAALWPRGIRAQQKPAPVIGFLAPVPRSPALPIEAFLDGLREAGFVDGQNAAIEYRWAEGDYRRLPELAADLVRRRVDVIVAATLPAALAAKTATGTIPIVFFTGGDPVEQGLVASFSHPGANLTGVSIFTNDLGPKRLQLLREAVPKAGVIGYLANLDNPNLEIQVSGMQEAARLAGARILVLGVRAEPDIEAAIGGLAEQGGDGLVVGADPFLGSIGRKIAALAARHRIPAIAGNRLFAEAGGLIAYSNRIDDAYRQVGLYTGRVLHGAKPADLPVVQPTRFELFINLQTAQALGLAVPQSILARADEVIE